MNDEDDVLDYETHLKRQKTMYISYCYITVSIHHDQVNYKRKHLIENFHRFSEVESMSMQAGMALEQYLRAYIWIPR